jgi:hypothetical protein
VQLLSFDVRLDGTFIGGQGSTPRITTFAPHAGLGILVPIKRSVLMVHGFVGLEHIAARVDPAAGVESVDEQAQKASRTVGTLGIVGAWGVPLSENGWFFLSPSVTAVLSPTEIVVDDQSSGTLGTMRVGLHAGIAWAPPPPQGVGNSSTGRQ